LEEDADGAVDEEGEHCGDLTNEDGLTVTVGEDLGYEFEDGHFCEDLSSRTGFGRIRWLCWTWWRLGTGVGVEVVCPGPYSR